MGEIIDLCESSSSSDAPNSLGKSSENEKKKAASPDSVSSSSSPISSDDSSYSDYIPDSKNTLKVLPNKIRKWNNGTGKNPNPPGKIVFVKTRQKRQMALMLQVDLKLL